MIAFDAAVTQEMVDEVEANLTGNGSLSIARRMSTQFLTMDSATLLARFEKAIADDPESGVAALSEAIKLANDWAVHVQGALELAEGARIRIGIILQEIQRQNPV